MAGLQRSAISFRRQGSSGIVWDDRFLSGELNQVNKEQQDHHEQQELQQKLEIKVETTDHHGRPSSRSSTNNVNTIERSRSNGGQRGYRTGKVSPAIEPPSPKVSACGFCSAFGGKPARNHRKNPGMGRSR